MKSYTPLLLLLLVPVRTAAPAAGAEGQMVEITAASDNTFHVAHEKSPLIRAHSGELLRLRVTSQRGTEAARDETRSRSSSPEWARTRRHAPEDGRREV